MKTWTLFVTALFLTACNDNSSNEEVIETVKATQSDRALNFLQDYASVEMVELGSDYSAIPNIKYNKGHSSLSTHQAVKSLSSKLYLKDNQGIAAIANAYTVKGGGIQCIVVHRENPTQLTVDHEIGHCFQQLLIDKLKKQFPAKYDAYKDNRNPDFSRYLTESFAEMAAGTIAFSIDGDTSYLQERIVNAGNLPNDSDSKPYKLSVKMMKSLIVFLEKRELPSKHSEQVKEVLDNFYFNPDLHIRLPRM